MSENLFQLEIPIGDEIYTCDLMKVSNSRFRLKEKYNHTKLIELLNEWQIFNENIVTSPQIETTNYIKENVEKIEEKIFNEVTNVETENSEPKQVMSEEKIEIITNSIELKLEVPKEKMNSKNSKGMNSKRGRKPKNYYEPEEYVRVDSINHINAVPQNMEVQIGEPLIPESEIPKNEEHVEELQEKLAEEISDHVQEDKIDMETDPIDSSLPVNSNLKRIN